MAVIWSMISMVGGLWIVCVIHQQFNLSILITESNYAFPLFATYFAFVVVCGIVGNSFYDWLQERKEK